MSNTPTYGGVTRSTYTWWAGSYTTAAGAMSLSMLATTYDAVKSGNDTPDMIIVHESEFSSYEALLQPQVRFQFATAGYPKIDGGFQAMMFRGAPIIADEYCTDGYAYFLNSKYLKFFVMNHPDFPTDKMGFSTTKMREPTDQDGKVGRHIAHYKSSLIKLGNSNHTILTNIKRFANMVLYEYPQQAKFNKNFAVATTE